MTDELIAAAATFNGTVAAFRRLFPNLEWPQEFDLAALRAQKTKTAIVVRVILDPAT